MTRNLQFIIYHFTRRRFPFVYVLLRFCYQAPFILIAKFRKNIFVPCKRIGDETGEHLFGYYDKSPWDANGMRILLLNIPFADHHSSAQDPAAVIKIFDTDTRKVHSITNTRAWNLQLGCRLQWLGPDFQQQICFNDFRDRRFVGVILDIESGDEQLFDLPFYDITNDGTTALSLDFERLHKFRPGYGYDRGTGSIDTDALPKDNGIWNINLKTGLSQLIISISQLANDTGETGPRVSATRFNHIMINPSGSRFMFLYRWRNNDKEFTRLYTANLDGSDLFCLSQDGLVSHATWKNDEEILAWTFQKSTGEHYYLFKDKKGVVDILAERELTEDGHPSYSPCGRWVVTDTYANRARQRRLLLYDTKDKTLHTLGAFYAPFRYSGETRCDLHPRWKRDGSEICFDSAFEGDRQMYVVKFNVDAI